MHIRTGAGAGVDLIKQQALEDKGRKWLESF